MAFLMPTLPAQVDTDVPMPKRKLRDKRAWTKQKPNPWDEFLLNCEIGSSFLMPNPQVGYAQQRGRRVGVRIIAQQEYSCNHRTFVSRLWVAEKGRPVKRVRWDKEYAWRMARATCVSVDEGHAFAVAADDAYNDGLTPSEAVSNELAYWAEESR